MQDSRRAGIVVNMAPSTRRTRQTGASTVTAAVRALRAWTPRQVIVAVVAGTTVAAVIGVATVLIPNPFFARDIPPVWWNHPVWLLTSALSGVLLATYVRPSGDEGPDEERRSGRMGMAGGILAWFAVGCPVCNKLALLAFGYSGAITWFTPIQPFLAVGALFLTGAAVLWRLRGQVACPIPAPQTEVTR